MKLSVIRVAGGAALAGLLWLTFPMLAEGGCTATISIDPDPVLKTKRQQLGFQLPNITTKSECESHLRHNWPGLWTEYKHVSIHISCSCDGKSAVAPRQGTISNDEAPLQRQTPATSHAPVLDQLKSFQTQSEKAAQGAAVKAPGSQEFIRDKSDAVNHLASPSGKLTESGGNTSGSLGSTVDQKSLEEMTPSLPRGGIVPPLPASTGATSESDTWSKIIAASSSAASSAKESLSQAWDKVAATLKSVSDKTKDVMEDVTKDKIIDGVTETTGVPFDQVSGALSVGKLVDNSVVGKTFDYLNETSAAVDNQAKQIKLIEKYPFQHTAEELDRKSKSFTGKTALEKTGFLGGILSKALPDGDTPDDNHKTDEP